MIRTALLSTLLATATPALALDPGPWTSAHFAGNPLAGTLWTGDGKQVDAAKLEAAVKAARFIAIGEIHTNADHHRLQARIVSMKATSGAKPAVVWEMVPQSLQPLLDKAAETGADKLGEALNWEKRGWPSWAAYRPIAEAALANGLAMRAGDLDRETIRTIGKQGTAALEAAAVTRIGLDLPFAQEAQAELMQELRDGHCGMLPEKSLPAMVTVQRARDGALAAAMLEAGDAGAILIAGNGHIREDRAAPAVLEAIKPGEDVLTIAFLELGESEEAASYLKDAPFDFVMLTPKADMTDHCAALKEQLSRPKQ